MDDIVENDVEDQLEDNVAAGVGLAELLDQQGAMNKLSIGRMKMFLSRTTQFLCLYGLLVLVLINLSLTVLKNDTKQLILIENNWSQKPIVDIVVTEDTCPIDYENIINGKFLGTYEGCNCVMGGPVKWNNTYKDTCSRNDKDNCDDIRAVSPVRLDNINGQFLWVKRAGPNFTKLNHPVMGCSLGFKTCGYVDNYLICMPVDQHCPISDIQVVPKSVKTPSGYSALSFNTFYKLIFTRENGKGRPIVDFKFEEGQPCIDPDEHPSPSYVDWHILDRRYSCAVQIEGETHSSRYHKFFSTSSYELYNRIKLIDELRELPDYDVEKYKNYQRSLYWTSWIPWDFECERNTGISRELIAKHINKVRKIADSQSYIFNIALYCYIIAAPLHVIIWTTRSSKYLNNARPVFSFVFGVLNILQLSKVILVIRALGPSIELFQVAARCSDSIANYSLKHIASSLKYNQWADILAVIIEVFTLVVDTGTFFMIRSRNKIKID